MKIHIIGIGGISLSGLATILVNHGHIVSGSDQVKSNITQKLEKIGVKIYYSHSADNIKKDIDIVVYSAAIKQDNPEIVCAKNLGIKIIDRAKLMGIIAEEYKNVISIAGTHGKTTTTGMIATIFLLSNKNPTIHIGGELPIIDGNIHIGGNEYFITEACEYYDSFLSLASDISVILNIQPDHLDYFKNMQNLQNSFQNFANNTKLGGLVVKNFEDENCKEINFAGAVEDYGIEQGGITAKNISQINQIYSYDLYVHGKFMHRIELSVEGRHNIYNSLAAIAVSLHEKIDIETIAKALKSYQPSKRRFNKFQIDNGALVIHDYAHHPTEIRASIEAAKGITKGKLIVVFEPHTYSRTQYLWDEFTECFVGADKVILTPIYPARETPIEGITSKNLSKCIKNAEVEYISSLKNAFLLLNKYSKCKNCTILILGAGTIVQLAEMFGIK